MTSHRSLSRFVGLCAVALVGLASACSSSADDLGTDTSEQRAVKRNFDEHPAIVEIDEADHLYALSDPHGNYDQLVRLLTANDLIEGAETDPSKVKWTGGTATLVIAGDLIDKGGRSVDVIDLLRALQPRAEAKGGRVIALMGNHEAEFLDDPHNDKAMSKGRDKEGINPELEARGIEPKDVARGADREGRGRWLIDLPLAVRVKKWFFAHGGNTDKMSLGDLRKKLEKSIRSNGFGDKDITGKDSILQKQKWYGNPKDDDAGEKEVKALGGVKHIAFGHDPGAFDDRGRMRMSKNGRLVKLDVAMGMHEDRSPNAAYLLHVSTKGEDTVEVLDERGKSSSID